MPSMHALRLLLSSGLTMLAVAVVPAHADTAKPTAFLGVVLHNDNEGYEPTSDAERGRMAAVGDIFKKTLEGSGGYKFITVPPEMRSKIAGGQTLGSCSGCEGRYGRELGSELVAWVEVQKISNLILNMTVYIADVASQKMSYIHSVDIRGNTDESWSRSIIYLLKNYPPQL